MMGPLSPLSIVVFLLLFFQLPLSLLMAARVDEVQLELLNVDEPLPIGQSNVIALLTKVWFTNYFRDHEPDENNVSNFTIDFTYQDQETTNDGNSIVVTFLADLSYDVPSTNDVAVDDVELLKLPFSEMEWVFGYSRSLRLSGGALAQFVGPVLILSAAGNEIQPVRTTTTTAVQSDESDVIATSGNFDVLGLFMVLGVGAVALLLCTFAAVLLSRALAKRKCKESDHV